MIIAIPKWQSADDASKYLTSRSLFCLFLFCYLAAWSPCHAQSGRNKPPEPVKDEKQDKRPKLTIAEPNAIPSPTPTANTDDPDTVRVQTNLVSIPAVVVDQQGHAVTNLTLPEFELLVNGSRKDLSGLLRAETPVRLALLFDNSSSLTSAREFEKQAAMRFIHRVLRPVDQAAVYSVATYVVQQQPLTSDRDKLVRAIDGFGKPEGATALFDAIVMAARYLRTFEGRRVIVIVSDGEDTISDAKFIDALKGSLTADCQIYVVQTKQIEYLALTGKADGGANLRPLVAETQMKELAEQTGGTVFVPLVSSDLDRAFTQIAADLAQQYILTYYPVDEVPDGVARELTVRAPAHPGLKVRSRRSYYPSKL